MSGPLSAEISTHSMAIVTGGPDAATSTCVTCAKSQAISGQFVQGKEAMQAQSENRLDNQ